MVERPVKLLDEVEYQLVNAQRNRCGIVPREKLKGREILVKTQFEVKAGDFLISKRQIVHGACGVVPLALDGAVVSNEYAVLRPNDRLLAEYLENLSHTPYFQRTCFHSSVGVDVEKMVFRLEKWLKFYLPIPPVSQQLRIASTLLSVDEAIDKTNAVIEILSVLKGSILEKLLSQGLPGHHDRFKVSEIGTIPNSWKIVKLDDCIAADRPICYGILKPGTGWPGGIPVVKVKDIKFGRILVENLLLTSPELDRQYRRSRLRSGDILLSIRGTTGRLALVPPALDGANITQDSARISVCQRISSRFVYHCLHSIQLQKQIADYTRGQAVKGINIRDVRQLKLPLPSTHWEQDGIADTLDRVEAYAQIERQVLRGCLKSSAKEC